MLLQMSKPLLGRPHSKLYSSWGTVESEVMQFVIGGRPPPFHASLQTVATGAKNRNCLSLTNCATLRTISTSVMTAGLDDDRSQLNPPAVVEMVTAACVWLRLPPKNKKNGTRQIVDLCVCL